MASAYLFLTTASSLKEARKLTGILLRHRAAACVTILPKAESHYRWKEKIEKAAEFVLLIKTKPSAVKRVETLLEKHHSYSVPEIIGLPIEKGSSKYLSWLKKEVR